MKAAKEMMIDELLIKAGINGENETFFKNGASMMYDLMFCHNQTVIDAYEKNGRIFLNFGSISFELTKKEALDFAQMIIVSILKSIE